LLHLLYLPLKHHKRVAVEKEINKMLKRIHELKMETKQ